MKGSLQQPQRLDVISFAKAQEPLSGELSLAQTERVRTSEFTPASSDASVQVRWTARGELRRLSGRAPEAWLHLTAEASVPQVCQRCLDPMIQAVHIDRWFRFVESEALAEELDVEADEEVLALTAGLDLPTLVEDEVLLALPLVPRHDTCPRPVATSALSRGTHDAPDHPFAALKSFKPDPGA